MELKEWIKSHKVWSVIIGLVLLYIIFSFLPAMYSSVEDTAESARSSFGYGGAEPEEALYDSGYESEAPAPMMAIERRLKQRSLKLQSEK